MNRRFPSSVTHVEPMSLKREQGSARGCQTMQSWSAHQIWWSEADMEAGEVQKISNKEVAPPVDSWRWKNALVFMEHIIFYLKIRLKLFIKVLVFNYFCWQVTTEKKMLEMNICLADIIKYVDETALNIIYLFHEQAQLVNLF